MNRGIYSVVNGMLASQHSLEVISNNLANSNTAGFKSDQLLFNEQLERELSTRSNTSIGKLGSGPVAKSQYTNFGQGALTHTGNPLDLALEGNGMFAVQGPGGQVQYTRGGEFTQDSGGSLVTKDGRAVLGPNLQPVQLKPGPVVISASGQISAADGAPAYTSIGIFVGTFTKEAAGAFQSQNAVAQAPNSTASRVNQGSLEASNVNPISSMVDMISIQRSFDMAQKSVMAEDDMTQKLSTILS